MRLVEPVIAAGLLAVCSCAGVPVPQAPAPLPVVRDCSEADIVPPNGTVIRMAATAVIDGDSFCLGDIEIRSRDFNAPEWDEPGGPEARAALAAALTGAALTCEVKGRSFDRALAVCRLAGGDSLKSRLGGRS